MSDLPTRERMRQKLFPEAIPKDREDVMIVSNAYADSILKTHQEFIDDLRKDIHNIIDMGDDNLWVMADCGPWEAGKDTT